MLLSIQFPYCDLRGFLESDVGLLGRPKWPAAIPDRDFVRSFGIIRKRPRGGIQGWIGEDRICEARRAFRFHQSPIFRKRPEEKRVPLQVAYRRFYFDGLATGKLEVGLFTQRFRSITLSRKDIKDFFYQCLSLPVRIASYSNNNMEVYPLWRAGSSLASLYTGCSVSSPFMGDQEDWWVYPATPLLVLISHREEGLSIPFPGHHVPGRSYDDFSLSLHNIDIQGYRLSLWSITINDHLWEGFDIIRSLRICLSRLYAEYSCLLYVLQVIGTGKLTFIARSEASQRLQYYLNRTISIISQKENRLDDIVEPQSVEIAREAFDLAEPGQRDALLEAIKQVHIQLKKFDVRLNVRRQVESFVNNVNNAIYTQNYFEGPSYLEGPMGDQNINYGQAGAVGRNARVNFTQVWQKASDGVDLNGLANELSALREELKKRSSEPEHDLAVAAVAQAEIEAKKGDGPKAFEFLSKAGKWVLGVAKEIGVKIATEALNHSLGIVG